MSVTARQIAGKFPELLNFVGGSQDVSVHAPCSSAHPVKSAIVYIKDSTHIENSINSGCSILIVDEKLKDFDFNISDDVAVFLSSDLQLAMAKINQEFFPVKDHLMPMGDIAIHNTAIISSSAIICDDAVIGPYVVVGKGAKVGKGSFIGTHTVIENHVEIGKNCQIFPFTYIGHHSQIGNNCVIHPHCTIGSDGFGFATDNNNEHHRKPHYGRVILEDRVELGAGVHIDRGAYQDSIIGEGTKVDNYCHFGHNIKMGKRNLVTAGFVSAGSANIGDDCVFGGRVSVNGHIHLSDKTVVGALSGVTNSIKKPGMYGGFPAIDYKTHIKAIASMANLPKMRKEIAKIKKKLNLD